MTFYRQALFGAATCFALLSVQRAHALDEESESADDEEGESADEESEPASEESESGEAEAASGAGDDSGTEQSDDTADRERPVAPPARSWARIWLGFTATLDLAPMPSGSDLCKLSPTGTLANTVGAYCTNPDGSDFPSRVDPAQNDALIDGASGKLDGGLTDGNLRVLFAADYAPISSLLMGIRLGYAFNGYTGNAVSRGNPWIDKNFHVELRATYIFGKDPLTEVGFAPMVFLSGGASEFAAHVTRFVSLTGRGDQPVNIWIVRGPWFAAVGAGARYQFSQRVAFNAALRLNTVFGEPSVFVSVGPDIGVSYGF